MLARLILLFTVVPLVELVLLLQLAEAFGWQSTLLLVLTTGVVGAFLARWQGWQAWRRVNQEMQTGRFPAAPLIDGLLILVAAALLVTPGVLTDMVGFSLLFPPSRAALRRSLASRWKGSMNMRTFTTVDGVSRPPEGGTPDNTPIANDRIIDVKVMNPEEPISGD